MLSLPSCILGWRTPTTVKCSPLMRMDSPTAQAPEKSLVLASEPRTQTWARCCVFGAVEEAALIGIELDDVGVGGARADYGPGVGVQVVLDGLILKLHGRDVDDFRDGGDDAVNVVEGEADLDAGFVSAGLLAGLAGEDADGVGAPLGKDGFNGVGEAGAVGEEQHDRGDAPGHADDGDGGAAAVEEHRFPGLAENVFQHGSS